MGQPALHHVDRGDEGATDGQPAVNDEQIRNAKLVWDYHPMGHDLRSVDVAIGLGSHDLGVAAFSAELYRAGSFPTLVFTGGNSTTTAKGAIHRRPER